MAGSQLSTLERQRGWACNIEEQLWGLGAPGLLRRNISVIEVFSQKEALFSLTLFSNCR